MRRRTADLPGPPGFRVGLLARWRAWRLSRRRCGSCDRTAAALDELEQRIDQGAVALLPVLERTRRAHHEHYVEAHVRGVLPEEDR